MKSSERQSMMAQATSPITSSQSAVFCHLQTVSVACGKPRGS